ncbi:unnamed protein product [Parnassius mnemosyne]|uniref:MADF domain-containing protein n=1 Tax=Parnassius mnemosyne TaxID=213953 RepID=A0AAV1KE84_9NEOP
MASEAKELSSGSCGSMSTEKEVLLQIIDLYREMPYLYNKNDKNYLNKAMREEGFKVLLNIYKYNEKYSLTQHFLIFLFLISIVPTTAKASPIFCCFDKYGAIDQTCNPVDTSFTNVLRHDLEFNLV